jgi:hypothetical protein
MLVLPMINDEKTAWPHQAGEILETGSEHADKNIDFSTKRRKKGRLICLIVPGGEGGGRTVRDYFSLLKNENMEVVWVC